MRAIGILLAASLLVASMGGCQRLKEIWSPPVVDQLHALSGADQTEALSSSVKP